MIAELLAERLDVALNRPHDLHDALVQLEHKRDGSLKTLRIAIIEALREIKS